MHPKRRLSISLSVAIIILIAIATRMLLLYSDALILDIDECTIGLMANHLYKYGEVSPYFWGQAYGFSLVETTVIAIGYFFGGMTDHAVKIPMLMMWIAGVVLYYRTLVLISDKNRWLALLVTLLFVVSPTWALWAMKARGGYLTAFLANSVVMYLLFSKKYYSRSAWCIITGLLLLLIYEAQGLWMAALLPFVVYRLIVERSIKKAAYLIVSFALPAVLLAIYKSHLPKSHYLILPEVKDWLPHLKRIPEYFYHNLHGMYFLDMITPSSGQMLFATLFMYFSFLLLIVGLVYFLFVRRDWLVLAAIIGVVLVLCSSVLSIRIEPRYLLPAMGSILLLLYILADKAKMQKLLMPVVFVLCVIGARDFYPMKDFTFCNAKKDKLHGLTNYLQAHDIKYAYTIDWMLFNHVMFYSQEKVLARQVELPDRYQPISRKIDSLFYNHASGIAIVGFEGNYGTILFPEPKPVPALVEGYYIFENPTQPMLESQFMMWYEYKRK